MATRICSADGCKQTFEPNDWRQIYHSPRCATRMRVKKMRQKRRGGGGGGGGGNGGGGGEGPTLFDTLTPVDSRAIYVPDTCYRTLPHRGAGLRYCLTVCTTDAELCPTSESPSYVTVTVVVPTGSVEVAKVALPPVSSTVPSAVLPAVKVTGPVGLTVGEVMVAVKVAVWPSADGLDDEVMVAELAAWVMIWFMTAEVLPAL